MFDWVYRPDRLWLWLLVWTGVAIAVACWSPPIPQVSTSTEQASLRQTPNAVEHIRIDTLQPLHPGAEPTVAAIAADPTVPVIAPVISVTSQAAPESSYTGVPERSTGPQPRADARRQPPPALRRLPAPQ
ncbi:MAG: hypothetical protein ACKVIH_12155 [Burkholderiales bacterium]